MTKVSPFYSIVKMDVYHDESECTEGDNIKPENKVYGTGGLPHCKTC